jgi:hypothetical protein
VEKILTEERDGRQVAAASWRQRPRGPREGRALQRQHQEHHLPPRRGGELPPEFVAATKACASTAVPARCISASARARPSRTSAIWFSPRTSRCFQQREARGFPHDQPHVLRVLPGHAPGLRPLHGRGVASTPKYADWNALTRGLRRGEAAADRASRSPRWRNTSRTCAARSTGRRPQRRGRSSATRRTGRHVVRHQVRRPQGLDGSAGSSCPGSITPARSASSCPAGSAPSTTASSWPTRSTRLLRPRSEPPWLPPEIPMTEVVTDSSRTAPPFLFVDEIVSVEREVLVARNAPGAPTRISTRALPGRADHAGRAAVRIGVPDRRLLLHGEAHGRAAGARAGECR